MKKFKTIMIVLLSIWIINIQFEYNFINNKGSPLEKNIVKEEINSDSNFALMIEQSDGTYIESTSNKWPENYKLNIEKSKCVDKDGNVLKDLLTNFDNAVQLKTTTTSFCYLYFDIRVINVVDLLDDKDIWDSTLEDDGYRYVGTNPSNYICFGTTDKDECISDTDKYMYRIIGIFEGTDEKQHLKLIKKEALNTPYSWNSSFTANVDWDESDLYKGINGSYFLTNTEYSYMQNSVWLNKIEIWNYTSTNTLTYENYSNNSVYGPYYYHTSVKSSYLNELNRDEKSKGICSFDSNNTANCNVGSWKIVSGKISLMYVSDYLLSLGSEMLEHTNFDYYGTFKTGWIHLSNNDSSSLSTTKIGPPNYGEWTMTRYGADNRGVHYAYELTGPGPINSYSTHIGISARPVFYLTNDIELKGEGMIDNPYIITN